MMVTFDFLSEPLVLSDECVSTVCIENQTVYRAIISAFLAEDTEEVNVVFSENFTPMKFKGNIVFIDNVFSLNYSNTVLKKLYEQVEKFCHSDIQAQTAQLRTTILSYFDLITKEYDYDLDYSTDMELVDIFKALHLRPSTDSASQLENLLNFIVFIKNYTAVKCFVLLNVHLYFTHEELDRLYKDLTDRHITVLVIENMKSFDKNELEKVIICDKDMCEIVENSEI